MLANKAARRRYIGKPLRFAERLRHALFRVGKGHACHAHALDIRAERCGKKQVPVGRGNDDFVRLGKLLRIRKKRVGKIAARNAFVAMGKRFFAHRH